MTVLKQQLLLAYLDCDPGYIDGVDGDNTNKARREFELTYGVACNDDNLIAAVAQAITPVVSTTLAKKDDGKPVGQKLWDAFKSEGFTDWGAAGAMGNVVHESNLNPINLENIYESKLGYNDSTYTSAVDSGKYANFVHDRAGYGLAQWTYWSRKQKLLNFAKSSGTSIGNADMQIAFLLKELREDYPAVYKKLKSATSVKEASDVFMLQFERPADQSASALARRAATGEKMLAQYSEGVG